MRLQSVGAGEAGRERGVMAAVEVSLPQRKVVWPRKIEHQGPKAIPPWAEQGAQPPPPPVSHYHPFSPPATRRQKTQAGHQTLDDSHGNDLYLSKQTKILKSKSESQLNNYGTMFSLSVSATSHKNKETTNRESKSVSEEQKTNETTKSSEILVSSNERVINQTSTASYSCEKVLNIGAQITGEGAVGAVRGQVAKTCPTTYGEDKTSIGRQFTSKPQSDQHSKERERKGHSTTTMVTTRADESTTCQTTTTEMANKAGAQNLKNVAVGGKQPAGGKMFSGAGGDGGVGIKKDVPWRKGEVSTKAAAHMPPSPRLDNRKNISASVSSPPSVQPVIKEQREELPEAPWRKSPQLPRKPQEINTHDSSSAVTVSGEVEMQKSDQQVSEKSTSSKPSDKEKSSLVIDGNLSKSSITSISSTVSQSQQFTSNAANLPPHAPSQKKLIGSPQNSPKGSPVLSRRSTQITQSPALTSTIIPVSAHAPTLTSSTVPDCENQKLSDFKVLDSTIGDVGITMVSSVVVTEISSAPVVLNNTVLPISDIKPNDTEKSAKESVSVPDPPQRSQTDMTNSAIEKSSNEIKEDSVSVIASEHTQIESITSEVIILPPPPPEPCMVELDANLPPLPPPPATFLTEEPAGRNGSSIPFNILPLTTPEEQEPYVPLPVTSRIKSFEKQSSLEVEFQDEKAVSQPVRPVGPWVKKTSSGPVPVQEGWEFSPEKDIRSPQASQSSTQLQQRPVPPPPPPAAQQHHHQVPPQKPHQYTPQQYMSPTQLKRQKQQQLLHQQQQQQQRGSFTAHQPQLQQNVPHLQQNVPQVQQAVPQLQQTVSQLQPIPQLQSTVPQPPVRAITALKVV